MDEIAAVKRSKRSFMGVLHFVDVTTNMDFNHILLLCQHFAIIKKQTALCRLPVAQDTVLPVLIIVEDVRRKRDHSGCISWFLLDILD